MIGRRSLHVEGRHAFRAPVSARSLARMLLVAAVLVPAPFAGMPPTAQADAAPPAVRTQMLVDPAWLAAHLDDPGLVILQVGKTRDAYDRAHVPGARFVAFGDVAVPRGGVPNEMPSAEELTVLVRRLGITGAPGERIVIYGEDEGLLAARVFVALDYMGLAGRAALLDGQWAAWQAEARPVTADVRPVAASSVVPQVRADRIADRATVAELSRGLTSSPEKRGSLVDARPRAQFDGSEAGDGVLRPGHIPGAIGAFWKDDLQAGDVPRLRSAAELRARYAALGVDPDDVVVAYCRTGVQASHAYFVLTYLGYDVRLYDASFAEWSTAPDTSVVGP